MKYFKKLTLLLSLFTTLLFAQTNNDIKDAIFEVEGFQIEELSTAETSTVFSANIYQVFGQVKNKVNSYPATSHNHIFILQNNSYLKLDKVRKSFRSGQPNDVNAVNLMQMIKKDFKIKTLKDAETFEKALSTIHPYTISSSEKKIMAKKNSIYKVNDEWVFIRDIVFSRYEGFAAKVDSNGLIKNIRYTYNLQPTDKTQKSNKVPVDIQKQLTAKYMETIKVEAKPLKSAPLVAIFDTSFIELKTTLERMGKQNVNYQQSIIYKKDNRYHTIDNPMWGTQKVKHVQQLEKLLSKNFVLKNNTDATQFSEAIKVLMFGHTINKPKPQISQNGTEWKIIFKGSFNRNSAYIITTDTQGKIIKIMFNPKYKPSK